MTTVTDDERGGPRPGRAGHADPSLNAAGGVKKTARPGGLRRAIAFLNQQRKIALTTYAAVAVATACQLAIPLLVQQIIDVVRAADAARAMASSWRWPWLRPAPRSPRTVSQPSDRLPTKPSTCASAAAAFTSSSVASGRP